MPPSCKKILFNIAQIAYQVLFFLVYLQKKKAKASPPSSAEQEKLTSIDTGHFWSGRNQLKKHVSSQPDKKRSDFIIIIVAH